MKKWKRKFEEASEELDRLSEVRQMTKNLKKEIASLTNHNKVTESTGGRVSVVCECVFISNVCTGHET